MLSAGCATSKPKPYQPKYIYMVLVGGKLRGYPYAIPTDPEVTINTSDIVGGMCLPIKDWEAREKYIIELEDYGWKQ